MIFCEGCGAELDGNETSTTEAFEATGMLLCDDCAEAAFEAAEPEED